MSGGPIAYWRSGVPPIHQLVGRAAREVGCQRREVIADWRRRGTPGGAAMRARWAVMKAARECAYPLKRIGARLGGRDHSTVSYGIRKAEKLQARDPDFARLMAALRAEAGLLEARGLLTIDASAAGGGA